MSKTLDDLRLLADHAGSRVREEFAGAVESLMREALPGAVEHMEKLEGALAEVGRRAVRNLNCERQTVEFRWEDTVWWKEHVAPLLAPSETPEEAKARKIARVLELAEHLRFAIANSHHISADIITAQIAAVSADLNKVS